VQDEYKSCDVAVRDFVQGRKEATALPVKEVKVDGLRMTLNFIHSYGESGVRLQTSRSPVVSPLKSVARL